MKASTIAFAAACAVATASAAPLSEDQYQFLFTRYMDKFEKSYESNNMFSKYNTFKKNLDTVVAHNMQEGNTYTMAMNQFGDMSPEEFASFLNSKLAVENAVFNNAPSTQGRCSALPSSDLDWSKTINNPMKNQGRCGSCWAFSVVGALEYRHAHHNSLSTAENLSEQQLVDCDTSYNNGCNGGLMIPAFEYIKRKKGLCTTDRYPYTGRDESCKDVACTQPVGDFASIGVVRGGEEDLVEELANGPVTVAVAASATCFQFYSSGVLSKCYDSRLNHAVLAVGYGKAEGKDYIKIRNSWGSAWGEQGYFRVEYCDNIVGLNDSIRGGYDAFPKF